MANVAPFSCPDDDLSGRPVRELDGAAHRRVGVEDVFEPRADGVDDAAPRRGAVVRAERRVQSERRKVDLRKRNGSRPCPSPRRKGKK